MWSFCIKPARYYLTVKQKRLPVGTEFSLYTAWNVWEAHLNIKSTKLPTGSITRLVKSLVYLFFD